MKSVSLHPLGDSLPDFVRRILLNEMKPRDRHFGLQATVGEDRTGTVVAEFSDAEFDDLFMPKLWVT
jgi:hypothetical protein